MLSAEQRWGTDRRRFGFYNPDGWVLWASGYSEAAPADIVEVQVGFLWHSVQMDSYFYRFGVVARGGSCYYDPETGAARNSSGVSYVMVGIPYIAGDGDVGYTVEWINEGPRPGGVQNRWRVLAHVLPLGLGFDGFGHPIEMPYWHNRTYPEWPPLRRGRQRLPL
jgi:hypothetical protein